jgi:hypothetical protein
MARGLDALGTRCQKVWMPSGLDAYEDEGLESYFPRRMEHRELVSKGGFTPKGFTDKGIDYKGLDYKGLDSKGLD